MLDRERNSPPLLALVSWAFYDFANSSFSAIIQTFVFAAYFTKHVAVNETVGTAEWGFANGISAFFIAILAPVLGAIADNGKSRKIWIFFFTYLCILATSLLWFVEPNSAWSGFALAAAAIGIVGAELSFVFYNAALPEITTPETIGKWSGWGWGFGYAGGVASLVLALYLFAGANPIIHLDGMPMGNVRATFPLVGVWYALFSLPLFLFVPIGKGKGKPVKEAICEGIGELAQTLRQLALYKDTLKFLIASMIFRDGLTTLFAFGGVFAAALFGMDERSILLFGIAMNISSGIGAGALGCLDDYIGPKKLILISLIGLLISSSLLLLVESERSFWALGLALSIFVGPVQSASRSYMARVSPPNLRNEMFGFYALTGKATAFLGPMLVGWITYLSNSERAGLSVIVGSFAIGFLLMLSVREAK